MKTKDEKPNKNELKSLKDFLKNAGYTQDEIKQMVKDTYTNKQNADSIKEFFKNRNKRK